MNETTIAYNSKKSVPSAGIDKMKSSERNQFLCYVIIYRERLQYNRPLVNTNYLLLRSHSGPKKLCN